MASYRRMNILLVEDDDVAAEGIQRSLNRCDLDCPVVHAEDGLEALRVLRGEHPEEALGILEDPDQPQPCIILLDLNMPRMNGLEFLREVRADDELRRTVVFVLTTSDSDTDRHSAYAHNVAGYMVKSDVGPHFSGLTDLLSDYRAVVVLP